jgi:hypothetical protein
VSSGTDCGVRLLLSDLSASDITTPCDATIVFEAETSEGVDRARVGGGGEEDRVSADRADAALCIDVIL